MKPSREPNDVQAGHPRLMRCDVVNAANEESIRCVKLEQFRLWEYMIRTRHGIQVRRVRLGLWFGSQEYREHAETFSHGGVVEDVTRITLSLFESRHHYMLDIDRFVPAEDCETVKKILLSHLADSKADRECLELIERPGVCVSREIENPAVELLVGLSAMELEPAGEA